MLVLSRKFGERIQIADDIVIEIRDIYRDRVRIGIEAPREVPVMRWELLYGKTGGDKPSGSNKSN